MTRLLEDPATRTRWSPIESTYFRGDIQGLRALAVILVILNHASVPGLEGGYVGVDVFFVISGYVITSLLLRQPPKHLLANLGDFYARRIRRIVPAATLVLTLTVIVAYFSLGSRFSPQLLGDVRWASLFSANFRLIATGSNYFIPGVAPSLITHFWSLGVEEQFYLVYPLVVFLTARATSLRRRRASLFVVLLAGVALSALWSFHETPLNSVVAYYSPFTRFWELGLGGLVALLPQDWARRTPRANAALGVLALIGLAFAVASLNDTSQYPGVLAWGPCAASAVLLWSGTAQARGGPASWLSWRPCRYVGDISYSLYLFHFAWLMIPLMWATPPSAWWARPVEIAGAFVCSVASYHLLENPLRRSTALNHDRLAVVLLLLVCVALSWNATLLIGHLGHYGTFSFSR